MPIRTVVAAQPLHPAFNGKERGRGPLYFLPEGL